ncbi:hypothetical protein M0534_05115 [Methylonatrum kenyense]|uniref:hypothetical protein n=1 Tax=Methylonatrum kenyense TaxID=455253 RepID=UPI0020C158FE|nr:hypothetical protein [Methylonatrum kenyense]MCK8515706.1 hypothetical protein [Methylonatrum kenyense]
MNQLLAITPYPVLSGSLLLLVVTLLGYLARRPVHQLIALVFRELQRVFRLFSSYAGRNAERAGGWTADLALDEMRRRLNRIVHWDHDRLVSRAEQDLADLPRLRQRFLTQISALEESLDRSMDTPTEPPAWGRISHALAMAENDQTGETQRILADIRDTMAQYRADARQTQREAAHRRFLLLYRMLPRWRQVHDLMDDIQQRLGRLQSRVDLLRRRLVEFGSLRNASRRQVVTLVARAVWHFGLAVVGLVLIAAAVAVFFSLVAGPMQSLLGGAVLVAEIPTYLVTSGILVGFQLLLGFVMLSALRGTDLLPLVSGQEAAIRRLVFACSFGLMLLLSATGAALYYLLGQATAISVASASLFPENSTLMLVLGTASNAIMVFLLPFVLALAGFPLTWLVRHCGTALGVFLTLALHLLATVSRFAGVVSQVAGRLLIQLYDVLIFIPLWLERELPRLRRGDRTPTRQAQLPSPAPESENPLSRAVGLSDRSR